MVRPDLANTSMNKINKNNIRPESFLNILSALPNKKVPLFFP